MKKSFSTGCALLLASSFAITAAMPSIAAPLLPQVETDRSDVQAGTQQVQYTRDQYDQRVQRLNRQRQAAPLQYNGYRGYREYRPGYKRYQGAWYPAAAFIAGALITGAIVSSQPRVVRRSVDAHENWCYDRYRSYRASDNTFQPYSGPRKLCISPYS